MEYKNIHQSVDSKLFEVVTSSGIDFAYPTQTLHDKKYESEV